MSDRLIPIVCLALLGAVPAAGPIALPAAADDSAPLVPWGVHTVVTQGTTTYEGRKLRAVLVYGEVGNPLLRIENVRVKLGQGASRVAWQRPVDLTGAQPDPCKVAETWCGQLEGLHWADDGLHYDLVTPSLRLHCVVSVGPEASLRAACEPA